jgi:exodeoxyribonuclease VII small subunit
MNAARRNKTASLEKSLQDLEGIVEQLETGDLPLDKALSEFERGVRLSRECQAVLQSAEQKVKALMGGELADFDAESPVADDDDDEE